MEGKEKEQGFPGQTEKGREEEVMSEAFERSWEANMKLLVGNEIANSQTVQQVAQQMLQNAITNSNNAQVAYLSHVEELRSHRIENNRFTLDRLYGMFPEESAGTSTLLKLIIDSLKAEGWKPPVVESK